MAWNKIGNVVALPFVFFFTACGGDSGNSVEPDNPISKSDLVVETYDNLPVCSFSRDGVTAYVKDEKKAYVCENNVWTLDGLKIIFSENNNSSSSDYVSNVSSDGRKDAFLSNGNSQISSSSAELNVSSGNGLIESSFSTLNGDNHESSGSAISSCSEKVLISSSEWNEVSSSSINERSSSSKKISWTDLNSEFSYGEAVDDRDGQIYKTIKIGKQTWMAENLNYETMNAYCYKDSLSYCSKYGRLYTWAAAMDSAGRWSTNGKGCGFEKNCSPNYPVRGVCFLGWHLPTKEEYEVLISVIGDQSTAGRELKSTSGWDDGGNGSDAYGFAAFPVGLRNNYGGYYNGGKEVSFWGSTDKGLNADVLHLYYGNRSALLTRYTKDYGYNVRCVKD